MAGEAYLTTDSYPDEAYQREHGLLDRPFLIVEPIQWGVAWNEGNGPGVSYIDRKYEVYVESVDSKIPFLRLTRDGDKAAPFTPERP